MRLRLAVALVVIFALLFPLLTYRVTGETLAGEGPPSVKAEIHALTSLLNQKTYDNPTPNKWMDMGIVSNGTLSKACHANVVVYFVDWKAEFRPPVVIPGDLDSPLTIQSLSAGDISLSTSNFAGFLKDRSQKLWGFSFPELGKNLTTWFVKEGDVFGRTLTLLGVVEVPLVLDIKYSWGLGFESPKSAADIKLNCTVVLQNLPVRQYLGEMLDWARKMGVQLQEENVTVSVLGVGFDGFFERFCTGKGVPGITALDKGLSLFQKYKGWRLLQSVRVSDQSEPPIGIEPWGYELVLPEPKLDIGITGLGFKLTTRFQYNMQIEDVKAPQPGALNFNVYFNGTREDALHPYWKFVWLLPVVYAVKVPIEIQKIPVGEIESYLADLLKLGQWEKVKDFLSGLSDQLKGWVSEKDWPSVQKTIQGAISELDAKLKEISQSTPLDLYKLTLQQAVQQVVQQEEWAPGELDLYGKGTSYIDSLWESWKAVPDIRNRAIEAYIDGYKGSLLFPHLHSRLTEYYLAKRAAEAATQSTTVVVENIIHEIQEFSVSRITVVPVQVKSPEEFLREIGELRRTKRMMVKTPEWALRSPEELERLRAEGMVIENLDLPKPEYETWFDDFPSPTDVEIVSYRVSMLENGNPPRILSVAGPQYSSELEGARSPLTLPRYVRDVLIGLGIGLAAVAMGVMVAKHA